MDRQIAGVIHAEAEFGSASSSSLPDHVADDPWLLLRPGFPESLSQVQAALPGSTVSTLMGYRRRAWRHHLQGLPGMEMQEIEMQEIENTDGAGRPLFLVQADEGVPVPNWPAGADGHWPPGPRHLRRSPGRRRGRERRPPPRARRSPEHPPETRERSRSRDE